jgi:hypothetical protein
LTYHVLKATDQIAALVDYARNNHVAIWCWARVEHRPFGAVSAASSHVVAQAPCTVTVVRPSGAPSSAQTGGK